MIKFYSLRPIDLHALLIAMPWELLCGGTPQRAVAYKICRESRRGLLRFALFALLIFPAVESLTALWV